MSLKHMYLLLLFFQTALRVLINLPSYVFYVILLVWFVYEIANDVHIKRTGRGILFTHEKVQTKYSVVRVQGLFMAIERASYTMSYCEHIQLK